MYCLITTNKLYVGAVVNVLIKGTAERKVELHRNVIIKNIYVCNSFFGYKNVKSVHLLCQNGKFLTGFANLNKPGYIFRVFNKDSGRLLELLYE